MGRCVARMAHECGSSDGVQVFEKDDGSIDGYCFACDTFVGLEDKKLEDIPNKQRISKTKEQISEEIEFIHTFPVVDLPKRRLRGVDLALYNIKIAVSEVDGTTPTVAYYPFTKHGQFSGYKCKLLTVKKMWSIGDLKDVDLFGWDLAEQSTAKRLIITEGEDDAVALRKVLLQYSNPEFKDIIPAVCSLPHGAGSAVKDVSRCLPDIRRKFKEVSLCFDNDAAGKKATDEVLAILPEATVITLPNKDANECLIKNNGKVARVEAMFNAQKKKNTRIIWGGSLHEEAKGQAQWGVSWPWDPLTEATRGIRKQETYYIGAAQKMGKSEVVDALQAHLIKEHGWKVFSAKPEQANKKSYKMLAGKVVSRVFHDPKIDFDEEAYERAGEIIGNNVCFLDLYQNLTWKVLEADIRAAAAQGIDAVFIDPLTNLTNGMSSSDINSTLQGVAQDLSTLAMDLDLAIFIFCHVNKPAKGATPFDRGGKITTADFAGSSAMGRSCNYMLAIEGNRDPDLPEEEKNLRDIVLLDDREYGETLRMKLRWNRKTGQFGVV